MTSRVSKLEIALVSLAVLGLALVYRYAWISPHWESHLAGAQATWDIPVDGVGRWFSAWTIGDGQAFAVIASDPLGQDQGLLLRQPGYRYGRAGFGWLAWIASLGQPKWVPYGMAAVGLLGLVGGLLLAIHLRPTLGRAAWMIVLNPAVLIGFAGDTSETVAVFALGLAMATGYGWVAMAVGVIRPTYLFALSARWKLLVWGAAATVALGLFSISRFGLDLSQYAGRLGIPLVGYAEAMSLSSALLGLLALVTVLVGIRAGNPAWVISGILVLCFTNRVLQEAVNSWRAAGLLFVLWAFGPSHRPGDQPRPVEAQWLDLMGTFASSHARGLKRGKSSVDVA